MKIVLVGYRAAGKSTLGRLLSDALDMPFLDVDRGIEQRIGDQTLTAFYKEVGEEGFRPIETDVVIEMCTTERAVIAFGAGSLMRARNQQAADSAAETSRVAAAAQAHTHAFFTLSLIHI